MITIINLLLYPLKVLFFLRYINISFSYYLLYNINTFTF
jgi:hypothetical protein